MKLTIDKEADALYRVLDEATAVEFEEVSPSIVVDYDAQNRIVGIEMLHLSKRSPQADTRRLLFETVEGAANP